MMVHSAFTTSLRFSVRPAALVSLTGLVVLGGTACGRSAVESSVAAPIAAVKVGTVAARNIEVPRLLTLSGSLIGAEEARVAAGAGGKVLATYVQRGSVVKRGTLLVRLDARTVGAQAKEATAQLESLRLQAAQSRLDCERNEQMFEKGAISRADYDRGRTQCESSKWSVSAAEARKNLITEALRDTEIRAPFSGMVVERFVSAGEYVRPDSPVVTLVDVDSLRVELTVPEADVPQVREGMAIDFHPTAGEGGTVYHGRIRYIGPSVRRQTRDAIVEAVVDNAGHDLRPGMFVTARLALETQTLPAIPEAAVRSEGSLRHVFVVNAGRLEDRVIQAGETQDAMFPVLSGLVAGEKVVVPLTPELHDGLRVE